MDKEPRYNLNYVLQETGLKADTLRAWERRYQLPQPHRSGGGHRLFSDYDVETIKWLMERQKEGMRISQAANLWRELESSGQNPLLHPSSDTTIRTVEFAMIPRSEVITNIRQEWLNACLNFDESSAEQILNQSFAQFSLDTVCVEILQAGLAEVGSLWYRGKATVQQEHFASELVIRRMHSLISAAPEPVKKQTILIGCPSGENHTISPLMLNLFLRYRGWKVIYLGANVPLVRLQDSITSSKPDLAVMVAMRLVTASALMKTAVFLNGMDVPVAFGGRIFTHTTGLADVIPGTYLGPDISNAVSEIERLLLRPSSPIEQQVKPSSYPELIRIFIEHKNQVDDFTLDQILKIPGHEIPLVFFKEANDFLAQDICSALALGDIAYIGTNFEWVDGLINNRNLDKGIFIQYLQAYLNGLKKELGDKGLPIIEWMTSVAINESYKHKEIA